MNIYNSTQIHNLLFEGYCIYAVNFFISGMV